ncbi:MAG: flagellar hook-basal body complex protein [Pseudomonadota bacterium]
MGDKTIIGLSRLISLRQHVDTIANNVANQTTPGFKSQSVRFSEYLTQAEEDDIPASPKRSLVASTGFADFSPGALKATGNPMDVAVVSDDAFLVVRTQNGNMYTRSGSLTVDDRGRLVTMAGNVVMTSAGELTLLPRDGTVSIAPDGTVSTEKGPRGRLQLVKFSDTRKLIPQGGALFSSVSSPSEIPPAQVRLASGVLESSNVNAVQEMSKLVQASRAYDQVAKVILGKDDPNELRKLAGEDGK